MRHSAELPVLIRFDRCQYGSSCLVHTLGCSFSRTSLSLSLSHCGTSAKRLQPWKGNQNFLITQTKRANKVNTPTVQCKLERPFNGQPQSERQSAGGERKALPGKAIDRPTTEQQFGVYAEISRRAPGYSSSQSWRVVLEN